MPETHLRNSANTTVKDRELTITRRFHAPRDLVFSAWTDPAHLPHWWGPKGFTITVQEIDIRAGGVWRYIMHGPDGTDYDNRIEYIEVVPPEKLVYSHGGGDDEDFRVTVDFAEESGTTQLTMRMLFKSAEELDKVVKEYGAIEGAQSTLDRLEQHLGGMNMSGENAVDRIKSTVVEDRILVLERVFDAPRELVFRTFTEAEHLKHWWGPKGWTLPVCKLDFRPGGVWHYCMRCEDKNQGDFYGMESWGKAVFREIEAPERIVYVDYFSDAEGNEAEGMPETLVTLTFEEFEGKTKLINRAQYATAEGLKTVIDMGMLQGVAETWDRLDELLAKLR